MSDGRIGRAQVMATIGGLRWENDENILFLLDRPNGQRRSRVLSRPSPRTPLQEITHLFPSDALSSRRKDSAWNNCAGRPSNTPTRKRRVVPANSSQTSRVAAILRKYR